MKWILAATLLLASCASATDEPTNDPVDAEDACVYCDGKADAHGVARDSYLAYGILAVANSLTVDELDNDVRLDRRAAQGIVDARPFHYIEQIDTVPFVGAVAFAALADYAERRGFVPACGDGSVQPLIEACDDGNTTSGDGCSATCETEVAPPPTHGEIDALIKGSDIGIALVDPDTYYLRSRVWEGRGYAPEIVALMERADGIIANQAADEAVGYDELAILSTTPFYDSLLQRERDALDDLWELFAVNSDAVVTLAPMPRKSLNRTTDIQRVGAVVIRPFPITSFEVADREVLERTQQLPRLNLDNDASTVELHDVRTAIADYEQVFTPAELAILVRLQPTFFERSTQLASPGRYEVVWDNVPQHDQDSGVYASFDGWEFSWSRTFSLVYATDNMGWVEIRDLADYELTRRGQTSPDSSPTRNVHFNHDGVRFLRVEGDSLNQSSLHSLSLMEHWQNGVRVYNRLVYSEFGTNATSGVMRLPLNTYNITMEGVFMGDIVDAAGQRYRLDESYTERSATYYDLVPAGRRSSNFERALPDDHAMAVAELTPGRYQAFRDVVLEIQESRTVAVFVDGEQTVLTPMGSYFEGGCAGRKITLSYYTGNEPVLRVTYGGRGDFVHLGQEPGKLWLDREYWVERR